MSEKKPFEIEMECDRRAAIDSIVRDRARLAQQLQEAKDMIRKMAEKRREEQWHITQCDLGMHLKDFHDNSELGIEARQFLKGLEDSES